MKRWILYIIPLSIAILAFLTWSYDMGYWRFNYPGHSKYPVRGIDISHHQGNIDWDKINKQKVHFVYMKATEGGDYKDPEFDRNWKESANIGLARGAYHFFSFCKSGDEQARNFLAAVPVDMKALPPVIDLEFSGNCRNKPKKGVIVRELLRFMGRVKETHGISLIIYATNDSYNEYLKDLSDIDNIWIRDILKRPNLPNGRKWTLWQYANNGRIDGITGRVDLNVYNGSYDDFRALVERSLNKFK
jgi:lysozyme